MGGSAWREEDATALWSLASHWKLFLCRGLTALGDRLWSFGVGLLLFRLYPASLTLVAAFGLTQCAADILAGARLGAWIDASQRLRAARLLLLVQNLTVAAVCAILAAFYTWEEQVLKENFF